MPWLSAHHAALKVASFLTGGTDFNEIMLILPVRICSFRFCGNLPYDDAQFGVDIFLGQPYFPKTNITTSLSLSYCWCGLLWGFLLDELLAHNLVTVNSFVSCTEVYFKLRNSSPKIKHLSSATVRFFP